jgi:hypothetical protein
MEEAAMSRRVFTMPRWRSLLGATRPVSLPLWTIAVALVSAAYLIGTGAGDSVLLASLTGVA